MDAKFTKGPFIVGDHKHDCYGEVEYCRYGVFTQASPNFQVATVMDDFDCSAEANANLFAAAPDLYEVAMICLKAEMERRKKLLPGAPATTYTQSRIDKIEAALSKARGETK